MDSLVCPCPDDICCVMFGNEVIKLLLVHPSVIGWTLVREGIWMLVTISTQDYKQQEMKRIKKTYLLSDLGLETLSGRRSWPRRYVPRQSNQSRGTCRRDVSGIGSTKCPRCFVSWIISLNWRLWGRWLLLSLSSLEVFLSQRSVFFSLGFTLYTKEMIIASISFYTIGNGFNICTIYISSKKAP